MAGQPIGGRPMGIRPVGWNQVNIQEQRQRQRQELERELERELEPIHAKVKLVKKIESPETSESEMRRFLREMRFENQSEIIMRQGPDSKMWTAPRKMSDKLTEFLTNVYLGDLYGNPLYDEERVGSPIQEYLYFLNPEDPLYQITSIQILLYLIYIYMRVNTIKFYDLDTNNIIVLKGDGTDDLSEFKKYFQEEYDGAPTFQTPEFGEVRTIFDIFLRISRINTIRIGRDISFEDLTDFSERSVRLEDSLRYSLDTLRNPLIKPSRE